MTLTDPTPGLTIVWFRRDLRLRDNGALAAAARAGAVLPIYILDDDSGRPAGAAGRWWLNRSLETLGEALARKGSPLLLRRGSSVEVLMKLAQETGARAIFASQIFDPANLALEASVAAASAERRLAFETFGGALIRAPWELKTTSGTGFKVFAPFWRALQASVGGIALTPEPQRLIGPQQTPRSDNLADWRLQPRRPDWSQDFEGVPGEAGGRAALARFIDGPLRAYPSARDRPAQDGASRLSAHLHWGELSPGQVWRAVEAAAERDQSEPARTKYLSEIAWREFAQHVLFQHPNLATVAHDSRFARLQWRSAPGELDAWTRGRTGFPIVDAGMRQLWRLGWMHNRVRMITASFLCKDLLIDWRVGERWFWDTLVDADEANNALNWQWVAGSGPDASPFFRVFNPVAQSQRFDPDGDYLRRWLPELAALPDSAIHAPWSAAPEVLVTAGVRLGHTYPNPLVDHGAARLRALAAFKATALA